MHPAWTAALNFVALGLLVVFRPDLKWSENRGTVVAVGILAALAGGLAWTANGPVGEKLLAKWQRRTVALRSGVVDAGEEPAGTVKRLPVTVANSSSHDVQIIGGTAGCSCTTTRDLPKLVPADGEVTVELQLTFRGTPGDFTHHFELLTDDKTQPKLQGVVTGRVAGPSR